MITRGETGCSSNLVALLFSGEPGRATTAAAAAGEIPVVIMLASKKKKTNRGMHSVHPSHHHEAVCECEAMWDGWDSAPSQMALTWQSTQLNPAG